MSDSLILCHAKGIPMKPGTRVDATGAFEFGLDPAKHDPFDVLVRLMKAAGAPERCPENDARHEALQARLRRESAQTSRR